MVNTITHTHDRAHMITMSLFVTYIDRGIHVNGDVVHTRITHLTCLGLEAHSFNHTTTV